MHFNASCIEKDAAYDHMKNYRHSCMRKIVMHSLPFSNLSDLILSGPRMETVVSMKQGLMIAEKQKTLVNVYK